MQGLITEHHFDSAEKWFPGIRRFYLAMSRKPSTFLELVWEYERQIGRCTISAADRSCGAIGRQGR
jgi:hypothetical protein